MDQSQVPEVEASSTIEIPEADDHEARGARHYQQKYQALEEQYKSVARYQGLIRRLESDASLVDVLENHIAGEVIQARDSLFDDDDDESPSTSAKPTPPKETEADRLERARMEGMRQADVNAEIKTFMNKLATNGVPEYLVDKFVAFLNNPNGLAVEDMFTAFNNMEKRLNPITGKPEQEKNEGPSGLPVAAVGGSTDRPDTKANIAILDGIRYVADPNSPF